MIHCLCLSSPSSGGNALNIKVPFVLSCFFIMSEVTLYLKKRGGASASSSGWLPLSLGLSLVTFTFGTIQICREIWQESCREIQPLLVASRNCKQLEKVDGVCCLLSLLTQTLESGFNKASSLSP